MSTNVQVRAITGEFGNEEMRITARGTMRRGEDVTCLLAYDGILEDGIIKKAANKEVKEK